MLVADRGVIQTPNFPRKFSVPIQCRWVIDASHNANSQDSSIVVYFTQLLVSTGLTFTEFDYYEPDSTFQLGGRLIHRSAIVAYNNKLSWVCKSLTLFIFIIILLCKIPRYGYYYPDIFVSK